MKDTSRVYVLRGIAELVAGVLSLFAIFVLPFAALAIGLFTFGFISLVADGVFRLVKSGKIARFR
jgi:hypothetical protein